ncbi:MAG: DedA family protein [Bacilli bacterium]
MQSFIISFMNRFGYIGILLLIAIENIFPPIPSEVILTFGGFMTTYTKLNVPLVIVFSTIGAVIGAVVLYYAGKLLNEKRLKAIVRGKTGKILRLKENDIDKAGIWFEKKGNKAVFFGRFVPIVRSLISIPAGMSNMHFGKFIVFTIFGSLIWNTVLVYLGSILGNKWTMIVDIMDKYSTITLIVLVLVFVIFVIYFISKHKKERK